MDAPQVQYVRTPDGVSIAYCVSGAGPPLVHMPFVFNHIQLYWQPGSIYHPWFEALASRFRLVQYDHRGMGMSSRDLKPEQYSPEALTSDLATVIEGLGLERCVVYGTAGPASLAVEFALRHPERIDAIIAGAPTFALTTPSTALSWDLAAQDWDLFLSAQAAMGPEPGATERKARVEVIRQIVTQQDYLNLGAGVRPRLTGVRREDVVARLGALRVPVLIIHPRDFRMVSLEESQAAAAAIPGARLAIVDGHALPGDVEQALEAISRFLADVPAATPQGATTSRPAGLSQREVEVLRLIAAGKSNAQIADELVLSVNTVIRHVSNVYAKTGAGNRAEATAFAAKQGLI
jgi:pimeloyl-ACP methyl ester carboxylesterase/DNA-binding CsgD family transcriptional regulator